MGKELIKISWHQINPKIRTPSWTQLPTTTKKDRWGSKKMKPQTILGYHFPRLLCLFHALLIEIPTIFFKRLTTAQRNFIWANKRPRIQLKILHLPKSKGGMGIPDFRKYFYATHLTRIIDWHCRTKNKDCVELERSW